MLTGSGDNIYGDKRTTKDDSQRAKDLKKNNNNQCLLFSSADRYSLLLLSPILCDITEANKRSGLLRNVHIVDFLVLILRTSALSQMNCELCWKLNKYLVGQSQARREKMIERGWLWDWTMQLQQHQHFCHPGTCMHPTRCQAAKPPSSSNFVW